MAPLRNKASLWPANTPGTPSSPVIGRRHQRPRRGDRMSQQSHRDPSSMWLAEVFLVIGTGTSRAEMAGCGTGTLRDGTDVNLESLKLGKDAARQGELRCRRWPPDMDHNHLIWITTTRHVCRGQMEAHCRQVEEAPPRLPLRWWRRAATVHPASRIRCIQHPLKMEPAFLKLISTPVSGTGGISSNGTRWRNNAAGEQSHRQQIQMSTPSPSLSLAIKLVRLLITYSNRQELIGRSLECASGTRIFRAGAHRAQSITNGAEAVQLRSAIELA
jgi:hypothetical protein